MTLFIFAGDMLVMAFMIGVAIWFGTRGKGEAAMAAAQIPLEDEILSVTNELKEGERHGS